VHHVRPWRGRDAPARLVADQRVQDAFQRATLGRAGEHALAHPLAIEGAVGREDAASEHCFDFRHRRAAGCGQLVRNGIGVDDGRAEPGELLGGGAFSAADAAGEPDDELSHTARYQRSMRSPQNRATMPAMAR
jgi:hypothetical protein